jgi:UDP:flavonoid glycosyltransferase YjiC (YdhE family)
VCCPTAGDMWENAARVAWAGLGTRLPRRFVTARGIKLAVAEAVRSDAIRRNVAEVAAWCAANDGADRAAELVERWLAGAVEGDVSRRRVAGI